MVFPEDLSSCALAWKNPSRTRGCKWGLLKIKEEKYKGEHGVAQVESASREREREREKERRGEGRGGGGREERRGERFFKAFTIKIMENDCNNTYLLNELVSL
jgi:hypothetical protein